MFPKASDKTLEEKLKNNHMGKTQSFVKPKSNSSKTDVSSRPDAHFAIMHYAGMYLEFHLLKKYFKLIIIRNCAL